MDALWGIFYLKNVTNTLGDFSFGNNSSREYQVNCGLCATTFDFGDVLGYILFEVHYNAPPCRTKEEITDGVSFSSGLSIISLARVCTEELWKSLRRNWLSWRRKWITSGVYRIELKCWNKS
ncbi:hypothetical protein RIR_jg21886.t1 [Rhizophagus irregularis DAOM 181602=DAOM 197198]|nr:hypothetical protein RhiirB3_388553 [Rhizophagus irregularis]GET63085.1 hypothetical protein RIR_jg21886.t1 [Rhizophagus irregularis DAOM 181602=DAOM 197198]